MSGSEGARKRACRDPRAGTAARSHELTCTRLHAPGAKQIHREKWFWKGHSYMMSVVGGIEGRYPRTKVNNTVQLSKGGIPKFENSMDGGRGRRWLNGTIVSGP